MQSPVSALPQDKKGDGSSSSEDVRQLQALDTSLNESSSHLSSPQSDPPTIQAEDAKVEKLWKTQQTHFRAYKDWRDQRWRMESRQKRYKEERDAVSNQLGSGEQVDELTQRLQKRLNTWQGRLDETTDELAKAGRQEQAEKARWEDAKDRRDLAIKERLLVIQKRDGGSKENSMN